MDVIFETRNQYSFTIEVGFFDTVLDIKEKIQYYFNIPISHQIFAFNEKLLDNGGNVQSCSIFHNSRITLLIVDPNQGLPDPPKIANLLLKLPMSSTGSLLCFPVNLYDHVRDFKRQLSETQGFPLNRLVLYTDGKNELQDTKTLSDCGVSDGSEIEVFIKPHQSPSPYSSGSKKPKSRLPPWYKLCLNDKNCYNSSNFLLESNGEGSWKCFLKFYDGDEAPKNNGSSSYIIDFTNFDDSEDVNYPDPGSSLAILAVLRMGFDYLNSSLKKNLKKNHIMFKWVFVLLNMLIAICGATITEINAHGLLKDTNYHKINVATAFICLLLSIAEITEGLRDSKAVWRKKRYCFWFYYPGKDGQFYGRPSLYFGIISSMFQVGLTLAIVLSKKELIHFDLGSLILAICDVVTLIVDSRPSLESTNEQTELEGYV